ncbi:MAG: hypothetical protein KDC87_16960, partial [Planctomycetes bacterium]|nr:hypothetical protein [Planctomycetota bacterium]
MTAGARPSWSPALLGALATAFYLATVQRQLWGDGVTFFDRLRQGGDQLLYNHALFLPLAKLVERVVSLVVPIDAERAMKVLAALAGGVGVGLTAAAGEILLRHRGHAAAAAAGVALMIGQWFHSTTAELHSLHGACAALLWLCLLAVVHLR